MDCINFYIYCYVCDDFCNIEMPIYIIYAFNDYMI